MGPPCRAGSRGLPIEHGCPGTAKRDTFTFYPSSTAWKLWKNWPHLAVLIQMFGTMSALPTMPPRRLETWNSAWREGGAEDAGQASEVWFFRRLGAAASFPLGRVDGMVSRGGEVRRPWGQ